VPEGATELEQADKDRRKTKKLRMVDLPFLDPGID
jgi:hypothetical protein